VIKSRRIKWVWYVARVGGMKNVNNILVGKPEKEMPLEDFRRR